MSHNHKHTCECEHENVRYCKRCKVIHCLDCNKEWSEKVTWTYSYTPNYWQLSNKPWYEQPQFIWGNSTGTGAGQMAPSVTSGNISLSKCNHAGQ